MVDSAKDAHFHWLAGDGQRQSGSEHALRSALTSGALSAKTRVWRSGWAEWLPANRVSELAASIPEAKRESALKPRRDLSVVTPPEAPGERTQVPGEPASIKPPVEVSPARASVPAGPTQLPPGPVRAKPSVAPAMPADPRASLTPVGAFTPDDSVPPSGDRTPLSPTSVKRDAKLGGPDPNDTLAPSSFGVIGAPRRGPPAATVVRGEPGAALAHGRGRAPMPTLSDEGVAPSATATLRPPGAVPPPARGVPAIPALGSPSSGAFSFEKRSAVLTPIPGLGQPGGSFETAPTAGLPSRPPASAPPAEVPTRPIDGLAAPAAALTQVVARTPLPEVSAPSSEGPLDSTHELVRKVPPEARHTPSEPMMAARLPLDLASEDILSRTPHRHSLVKIGRIAIDSRTLVLALSALCAALLVAVVALFLTRGHAREPEPVVAALASAPPAPPPVPGCRLGIPAALIAPNVERSVPPYATQLGAELALGFAATKTKGVGLRLRSDTLDIRPAFEEEGKDAVHGVVPLTRSGSLAFFVDRDDSALRSAHTVDEIPPFTLGLSDAGFSRVLAGSSSLLWPLEANVKITEPRAAAVGAFGYGVTFRRGGQSGAVLLGFVASDGSKKSELVEIPSAPKFLGTPVIAGSVTGALVAFAGRAAPDATWKVFVSLTRPGAAPSPARELESGSGGGAISPTLAALAPDRWLVQWTEGVSGQYQVRVQSFAADLHALGPAVLVSPKGANAGQGSLGAFEGGAASLFILTSAGHDELWGATLTCP